MSARIQQIYIALFNRPADPLGLAFWNQQTNNGANLAPMLATLASTAEYQGRFTNMTAAQQVNSIYQALFGRDADLAGLTFFVNQLQSGALTLATLAVNILDGAQGTDRTIIENKVTAAAQFTASIDTTAEVLAYSGDVGIAAGTAFLAGITADPATIPTQAQTDAALAALVAGGGPGVPGQTFTLTDAIGENVVGTAGNDTFVAVLDGQTNGTLQLGDQIDGKGGTDTLNLFIRDNSGDGSGLPTGASIKNVEIVNLISVGDTLRDEFKASVFAGATQVWQINANADTVTDVGAATTVGFRNIESFSADVVASKAAASVSIALDGVKGDGVQDAFGNQVFLTVSAADGGVLNTVDVSGAIARAVTGAGTVAQELQLDVTYGKNVTAAVLNTAVKTNVTNLGNENAKDFVSFDASGSAGAITVDLSGEAKLTTVNLGSGADVVTMAIGTASTTINLGAGNDTLNLDGTGAGAAGRTTTITLGSGVDTVVITHDLSNIRAVDTVADIEAGLIVITDFAGNQLDIKAVVDGDARATLTALQLSNVANAENLLEALTVVAGAVDDGEWATFQFQGSTYIFVNDSDTALTDGDGLIQLQNFTGSLTVGENFFIA